MDQSVGLLEFHGILVLLTSGLSPYLQVGKLLLVRLSRGRRS